MWTWAASHVFNPALLSVGASLLLVPVVIHLINRLRYRRVRFAAMEFLLASEKRNRRRVLLEQLLLLLLRMLIVAALVLLIARLILDPSQLSMFQGTKAHHLVLLDDSLSMRDRAGEETLFREAVGIVEKLLSEGSRRPDTQSFSLVRLSSPEQPVVSERDVNEALLTELVTRLDDTTFPPTHQRGNLVTGLERARQMLAGEQGQVQHLHLISDFRTVDWTESSAIVGAIKELDSAGVNINLVRVGAEAHPNLTVTELSGATQVAALGVPLRLKATVRNNGAAIVNNVRLSVFDGGVKLPTNVVLESIEPQAEQSHEFDIRLASVGDHQLSVTIEPDSLDEDNTRYLSVAVADAIPVLVLDPEAQGASQLYISDALAADPDSTGVKVTIGTPDVLRRQSLEAFRAIYVLGVPDLPADAIDLLERYVRGGGGLVWTLGPETQPLRFNEKLYREGVGLFPLPLAKGASDLIRDPSSAEVDLVPLANDLFAILAGEDNPFIAGVNIRRYFPPASEWIKDDRQRADQVETLARLRNGDPLILQHRFGRGRIVSILTTADTEWNDWAVNPSFVVFHLDLLKMIARPVELEGERLVGQPIELELNPADYTEDVEIAVPSAEGVRRVRLKAAPMVVPLPAASAATSSIDSAPSAPTPSAPAPGGTAPAATAGSAPAAANSTPMLVASFRETDAPGIYLVSLVRQGQQTELRPATFNVDATEGRLDLVSTADLRKQLAGIQRLSIQDAGQLDWVEGEEIGSEVRTALLILLALMLLIEQALAYRLSYHTASEAPAPLGQVGTLGRRLGRRPAAQRSRDAAAPTGSGAKPTTATRSRGANERVTTGGPA